MNKSRYLIRLFKPVSIVVVIVTMLASLSCQMPIYEHWYIENRLDDAVRVEGNFDRVFILPACSAIYFTYIHHLAMTYDQAKNIQYRMQNSGLYVSENNQNISVDKNRGLISIVLNDPTTDICPASVTGFYQVQVQNNSQNELSVSQNNKVIGTIDPVSVITIGPIEGDITQSNIDITKNSEIYFTYIVEYKGWQLGNTPTIYIIIP